MPWPRSKRTWALLLAGLAVCTAVLVLILQPKEPSYKGKRLSYWLDQLPALLPRTNGTSMMYPISYNTIQEAQADEARVKQLMRSAKEAVDALGTNCFRTLVARLGSTDSRAKLFVQRCACRLGLLSPLPRSDRAEIRRGQALTALARLDYYLKFMNGGDKLIARDLIPLTKHKDPGVRATALHALQEVAPEEYQRLEAQGQLTRK